MYFTILQGLAVAVSIMMFKLFKPLPWQTVTLWAAWTFTLGLQNLMPEILRGFDDVKWASLFAGPIPNFCNLILVGGASLIWRRLSFEQAAALTTTASLCCVVVAVAMISSRVRISVKAPGCFGSIPPGYRSVATLLI